MKSGRHGREVGRRRRGKDGEGRMEREGWRGRNELEEVGDMLAGVSPIQL